MAIPQHTIKEEVIFTGKALQTGGDIRAICKPASAGTGITFRRTDVPDAAGFSLADAVFSDAGARRSTIGMGAYAVQTVEHFLASLWALGIDNLNVEISGAELPALDGSAMGFFVPLKDAGVMEQEGAERACIKVTEQERVEDGDRSLTITPAEEFSVSYLIEYDVPSIGREEFSITPDAASFEKEIAPARTFCLKEEAEALLKAGLGKGADLRNTLVMDDDGPLGTTLRFPNEPVRHKVLDLIGDLYILGVPVVGKVEAVRSGHALNGRMIKTLYEKYVAGKK